MQGLQKYGSRIEDSEKQKKKKRSNQVLKSVAINP
jgi:hypothetical protein